MTPMDAGQSPDLLRKPNPKTGVVRLNRKPLMLIGLSAVFILIVLAMTLAQRGQQTGSQAKTPDTVLSSERSARQIISGQPDGLIAAAVPPELEVTPQARDTDPPNPDPSVASTTIAAAQQPDSPPEATHPPGIDPFAAEREAEYRRMLWRKQQDIQTAATADTRVEFKNQASQDRLPSVADPLRASIDAFQNTLRNAQAVDDGNAGGVDNGVGSGNGFSHDQNLQTRKEQFLQQTRLTSTLPYRRQPAETPYDLKTGTVIPGIMVGGINADLPGQILGQVSQHVWDTATGKHLLIPQGTKLVGTYDSRVAYGQKRVLVAWTRLVYPDGSTLELQTMPGVDQAGYGGLKDKVNNHYVRIFGNAILLSLIGAGLQLSQPDSDDNHLTPQQIVAAQIAQELSQVSSEMIRRNMNIQPTLKIRPGYRFNIFVNKDILLEPYAFKPARTSGAQ